MLSYPARFRTDSNGTILVTFRDIPAATFGDDEDDAMEHAVDALETALDGFMDVGEDIPAPSKPRRGERLVHLPAIVELKFALYAETLQRGVKKADLARRLKVHTPQVDRLFNIRHNSHLEQIEAAFGVVGKRIRFVIEDAA